MSKVLVYWLLYQTLFHVDLFRTCQNGLSSHPRQSWYFSCRMRRFVPFKIKLLSEIDDLWLKHFFIMCCFYTICYFDRTEDTIMRYYILLVTIFRGGYLDKYGRESGQVFYRLLAPGTSVHHSKPIYWYWRIF